MPKIIPGETINSPEWAAKNESSPDIRPDTVSKTMSI